MTPADDSHRVGRPLAIDAAKSRADQAAALGDPVVLRVLSAVASDIPEAEIAGSLLITRSRANTALARLESVALIGRSETGLPTLTAEAWVRFGRLLAAGHTAPRAHDTAPAVTGLPEAIESVARDLSYRFSSTFNVETVSRYVAESFALLSHRARVRAHLPMLTARYAADRLDALASARGLVLRGTPEVLFVCVQNAGRSQIAAAYLRHLAGAAVHVRTAGSAPAGRIDERIFESLADVGIPLGEDFPKPLTDEVVQAADYVITMGCGDACAVYPGRRYMDWDLEDPLLLDREGVDRVRDEIRQRVEDLIEEMQLRASQRKSISDSA